MSFGLRAAGIDVIGGLDSATDCRNTYEKNIDGAQYIQHDISTLATRTLKDRLDLSVGDSRLVFVGCSPCQFWSKVRTDKTKSTQTAFILSHFQRFVGHFLPGFVVVENVPGLYTRTDESILPEFKEFLSKRGYSWSDGIINAHDYGVPQNRMRYLLVAKRTTGAVTLPPSHPASSLTVADFIGEKHGFKRIAAGHRDDSDFQHSACGLSSQNLARIRATPKSGGDRSAWKDNRTLQLRAYRGKDHIFRDVYGRMYWDRPAPTITTRFNSLSNGRFGHPDEDRALSIREGATLQTFPRHFYFHGTNLSQLARQIGNAVPPELAHRIGHHLLELANNG